MSKFLLDIYKILWGVWLACIPFAFQAVFMLSFSPALRRDYGSEFWFAYLFVLFNSIAVLRVSAHNPWADRWLERLEKPYAALHKCIIVLFFIPFAFEAALMLSISIALLSGNAEFDMNYAPAFASWGVLFVFACMHKNLPCGAELDSKWRKEMYLAE